MDDKDREIQKTREYNYVLWTIIVVLGLMVVNLFAQQTCTNDEFVKEVSFASTISSIILSVIAIIMTVVSNDSISSLLHRFRDLHDDIEEVPEALKKTVRDFNESCNELKTIEKDLKILPSELSKTQAQINALNSIIDSAVEKLTLIHQTTTKTNEELVALKNSRYPHTDIDISNKDALVSAENLGILLQELSTFGKFTVYVISHLYKEKKIFNMLEYAKVLETDSFDYFVATIVVFRSLKLLSFKLIDENYDKVFFGNINSVLISEIETIMNNRMKDADEDDKEEFQKIKQFIKDSMTYEKFKSGMNTEE